MKNFFLTMLVFFAVSLSLNAQSPESFNYQAVARDNNGNPIINRTISIRISILDDYHNGIIVYSETHFPTTNQFGLFTLEIGNGIVQIGYFSNIDWGTGEKFIKVEMDVNNSSNYSLIGVSQLLSVPYAIYASQIGIQKFVSIYSDDTWQTGMAIFNSSSNRMFTISVSGTANNVLGVGNFAIINNTGPQDNGISTYPIVIDKSTDYVGIGTSFPNSKLEVKSGDVYINDINSGLIMRSPNGGCWRITVDNNGNLTTTPIACP